MYHFEFGSKTKPYLLAMLNTKPTARARIRGDKEHKNLNGTVSFYELPSGVLVRAEIYGLPTGDNPCGNRIFGFHIHEGSSCTGNAEDDFAAAGTHYDPHQCPHPEHAGDLPPLFGSSSGYAFTAFFTDRFTVYDIVGRTVIIHNAPDDLTSQPAGNAGHKIACGVIQKA